MRSLTRTTLLLTSLAVLSACSGSSPQQLTTGKYVLVEGTDGGGPFIAGQDNIWATLELHDGGRYRGEFHLGDDDPPFDGGWYVDGDSIRFSGEMASFAGHHDDTGILTIIGPEDSSPMEYGYMGPITMHPDEDTRTAAQKQFDAQQESAAIAKAKAEELAEREERRVRLKFRWSGPLQ